ncbi:hypothetical protein WMO79_09180 [Micrococcaceae bacterium Sec7.4]
MAGCLFSYVVDGSGLCYFFMGARGIYYMTLDVGGDVPWGAACYLAGTSHPFIACVVEADMTTAGRRGAYGAFGVRSAWPARGPAPDLTDFLIRWEPFRQPVTERGWFD